MFDVGSARQRAARAVTHATYVEDRKANVSVINDWAVTHATDVQHRAEIRRVDCRRAMRALTRPGDVVDRAATKVRSR